MSEHQYGTVHSKKAMFFHNYIGTATVEGVEWEMSSSMNGAPMVTHDDGRTFVLDWQDIVNMAIEAFNKDTESEKAEQV